MKNLVLIISAILLATSCQKSNDGNISLQDYLVFGHFYGMCAGEGCVETFKLTSTKIFEDTIDDYTGKNLSFIELENKKFLEVEDLMDHFPAQLLNETKDVFGCPDCGDQGGLYIEYAQNGVKKSWRISQSKKNVPSYLHGFMDEVNAKIQLLQN